MFSANKQNQSAEADNFWFTFRGHGALGHFTKER